MSEHTTERQATPLAAWDTDHWSTLAYVETCCVDANAGGGVGRLHHARMRTDAERHPLLVYRSPLMPSFTKKYPTRLKGGQELADHDDWDCLEDMERYGLVEVVSLVNGYVRLTEAGLRVAAELRAHKARGGRWADFTPSAGVDAGAARG